jgi:serine/threonine protein kinase
MMRMGSYDVIRPLAGGGMSDVFLGRSPQGRLVVLKRPRSRDPELLGRLRDEAALGSRLFHPNLVETIDTFEVEGLPILVLGYIEGPTVDAIWRLAPLEPACVARIGCQIAEALGALHGAIGDTGAPLGAVHRDVSARNIIITPAGDAVLIDLGISRADELRNAHTQTGVVVGTMRYLSPELLEGGTPSPASDFYALGCVLIEAAIGAPAFDGGVSQVAIAITTVGPLAAPSTERVHPRLRAVLAQMVARDPTTRMSEAHEISKALRELESVLGGGAAGAGPKLAARAAEALQARAAEEAEMPAPGEPQPSLPAPFSAPPSSPLSRPLSRPALTDAPLELAFEPRERRGAVEAPADPRDWYPKVKKEWSFRWLADAAKKLVTLTLVLAACYLAWRYYAFRVEKERQANGEPPTELDLRQMLERDAERLKEALENMPPGACDRVGAMWVYDDKQGVPTVVDSLGKVPQAYRKSARCAVPAPQ